MLDIYQGEETDFKEGQVILVNKELHWTSFDVIKKIRGLIQKQCNLKSLKVGHAGTLDPLATGLVIVCTGKATKKINQFQEKNKEYLATIELGRTTPSFDLETGTDNTYSYQHIDKSMLLQALESFKGEIEQTPPLFSAVKHEGKRAYHIARKGETVQLASKNIIIEQIELIEFAPPFFSIKINCSKGTYIRALARDIGQKLNSGAVLTRLVRTAIGKYRVEDALNIEDFKKKLGYL